MHEAVMPDQRQESMNSNLPITSIEDRPRVTKFKRQVISAIPRFPNNRATLAYMESKSLGSLLLDYFNWRERYVGRRPRRILFDADADLGPQWNRNEAAITRFLAAVERGDDLTPYLSLQPHTRGRTPKSSEPGAKPEDRWLDKDFVLHATGFHHFHLGEMDATGAVARSSDVLFATVSRHEFTIVGLFDHSVFERGSKEQLRLWRIHERISLRGVPPGTVVISQPVTTSGHRLTSVARALDCMRGIADIDPLLDDDRYLSSLYANCGGPPRKPRLEWHLHHLDFGILEHSIRRMFIYREGHN